MQIRSFLTANTRYQVVDTDDGLVSVTRIPRGDDDPARLAGRIDEDVAERFTALKTVVYNHERLFDKAAVAERRRVRFYLPGGKRLDTDWADEAALEVGEHCDIKRLKELDDATRLMYC